MSENPRPYGDRLSQLLTGRIGVREPSQWHSGILEGLPLRALETVKARLAPQEVGRQWLARGNSLALIVPSVIVPEENNIALDVRHPLFKRLRIRAPGPFSFDGRAWKS